MVMLADIIMTMKLPFHIRMGIKVHICWPFSHELPFELSKFVQCFISGGVTYYTHVPAEIQYIFGPQERRIITKTESNCDNSSCQVMMLQSYVLQLLCAQKILKDTSAQDTTKKV
jgi:hypothetical protein